VLEGNFFQANVDLPAGAAEVTLLDRETKALQCALLTAAAAGLQTRTNAGDFSPCRTEAEKLTQFQASLKPNRAPSSCIVHAKRFDWNIEFTGQPYDVVIACDVLYEAAAVEPMAVLLPAMLRGPADESRRILLTDPQDRTPENRAKFLEKLAARDRDLVVDFVKQSRVEHPSASGNPTTVIALRRKLAGDTIGMPLSSIR
jgi:predicted nicotinamide N-methyase